MKKLCILLLLVASTSSNSCDVFPDYNYKNNKFIISGSGDEDECNLSMMIKDVKLEILKLCEDPDHIASIYTIDKIEAQSACDSFKKKELLTQGALFSSFLGKF